MTDTPSDLIHRFMLDDTDIRGEIVTLNSAYQEAIANQTIPARLKPLLGEFFSGAALLGDSLKFEGILTLQVRGDGPVSLIMAESTQDGNIRGVIKLKDDFPEHLSSTSDLNTLLGESVLTITLDPAKGERYQGIIPIENPTLAECLSHYFQQSEQIESRFYLFSDESRCGGLFLQCLPPHAIKSEEEREALWETLQHLSHTVEAEELFSVEHETLLYRLYHEYTCRIFPGKPIAFACSCSEERGAKAIAALGETDAYKLLHEKEIITMNCDFCGTSYQFGEKELMAIFEDTSRQLH